MEMANTKVDVFSGTCGPRHDPYGYQTLSVQRFGIDYDLKSCGLTGDTLTVSGKVLITNCFNIDAYEMFEFLTGATPEVFLDAYYSNLNYQEDPMGHPSQYA